MAVTKPEFIQEAETAYNQTTPKETASFSVKKGDRLLAVMSCEEVSGGAGQLTISGGGFTWTLLARVTVNEYTEVGLWTTEATEDKTFKCTIARGATARSFGGNVLTFRKASGVGTAVKTNVSSGAPTLNITTTKEHSAIVVGVGDWKALDGKSRAWREGAGTLTEQTYNFINGVYTSYAGFHADAGTPGTYAVGLTAPAAEKYSIVAVEVFGEESGVEKRSGAVSVSGGGSVFATGAKSSKGVVAVPGGGGQAVQGSARRSGAVQVAGGGAASVAGLKSSRSVAAVTGGGAVSAIGTRASRGVAAVSGGGSVSAEGQARRSSAVTVFGGGDASLAGAKSTAAFVAVSGGGSIEARGSRAAMGSAPVSGGGEVLVSGELTAAPRLPSQVAVTHPLRGSRTVRAPVMLAVAGQYLAPASRVLSVPL